MTERVCINDRPVSHDEPVYVVAEIGINHNGQMDLVHRLIDAAVAAGADAVKFQKRDPDVCVPAPQREIPRQTPWGIMSYLEYRRRIELGPDEYEQIDAYCREKGIVWFASCWDLPSVEFCESFSPACYKIPSAALTDKELVTRIRQTGRPVILSSGMSTMDEICRAVDLLGQEQLILTHCTSTYPCDPSELNLRMIPRLREQFDCPIGYSGHEVGLSTTVAAVAMGACLVERHLTLDRAMWGSDQASSVEPQGLARLVRYIRTVELAMGDGVKRVYKSELPSRDRLRGTR
jgi:N-acetylneuraminate synthase